MRIHLPLHPHHFLPQSAGGSCSSPLAQIGGDLVLIELQGELSWEGDKSNGVIGVLGLDRPDKPTLHLGEHHLLHGKIATLQKPYAVIRRVAGNPNVVIGGTAVDGDASDEEEVEVDESTPAKTSRIAKGDEDEEQEEEEDQPLFAPNPDIFQTPLGKHAPHSSSPLYQSSAPRDYSSELDASSPSRWDTDEFGFKANHANGDEDEDDEEAEMDRVRKEEERGREKRKTTEKQRTRHYEVVGIVRKKVVFALRPEPIVTATILPD